MKMKDTIPFPAAYSEFAKELSTGAVIQLPGVVYGLGKGAANAARVYSELTGRDYKLCDNYDRIPAGRNDLVVCTTAHLTPHLMHHLYVSGDTTGAPGLIFGPTTNDLEGICARQAARFVRKRLRPSTRVFLFPLLDFAAVERDGDLFLSGAQPVDGLIQALSSNSAVLFLVTHSDGIDFALSRRVYACPFSSPAKSGELEPACQVLDRCRRFTPLNRTVAQAWEAGTLVPLTVLRAEIVILLGCSIVRLRDGILDPAYGVSSALLQQAEFSTLVTTWRNEFVPSDGFPYNTLINDLCAHSQVGVAVSRFNDSDFARELGSNLCVIGDPCFVLTADQVFRNLPTSSEERGSVSIQAERVTRSGNEQADLLRDATARAARRSRCFSEKKAKDLIAKLWTHGIATSNSAETPEASDLDLALLDFLGSSPFFEHFCADFRIMTTSERGICPSCFAPARVFFLAFPAYQVKPCRLFRCACCSDCILPEDWQVSLDLKLLAERLVRISGIPRGAKVLFCITDIYGLEDPAYRELGSPVADDGIFVFRIPDQLPRLPMRCNIIVVHQLQFGCIGFTFSILSTGAVSTTRTALSKEDRHQAGDPFASVSLNPTNE
jgi:hypothetical protein